MLGDLRDRLGPLGAVVGLERLDRLQGVVAVLGVVDLGERGFRTWVRRLRQGGKNIGADVEPAPLLAGGGEHLPQGLPEKPAVRRGVLRGQVSRDCAVMPRDARHRVCSREIAASASETNLAQVASSVTACSSEATAASSWLVTA